MKTLGALAVLLAVILVLANTGFALAIYNPAAYSQSALSSMLVGVTALLGFQRLLNRAKKFGHHGTKVPVN